LDGGDSLSEHPVLLLIPLGMLLLFPLLWLLVTTILALASGWFRLAKAYPDRPEKPLLQLTGQSGMMGPRINMRGVLRLGVCPSGLRIGIARLLGPFSKDFLVPWEAVSVSRGKTLFWRFAKLSFGRPETGALTLREGIADTLAEAAGRRWPELRADGEAAR
jgi:hypothetical protein